LTRASTFIVLKLAEGAGKHARADKLRYYLSAPGSATESAALLDVLSRLGLERPASTIWWRGSPTRQARSEPQVKASHGISKPM
jgi:hypothetical protein